MSGYAVNCTHFVICAAVLHTNAPCAVNKITFLHKAYRVFYRATRCEKNNKIIVFVISEAKTEYLMGQPAFEV